MFFVCFLVCLFVFWTCKFVIPFGVWFVCLLQFPLFSSEFHFLVASCFWSKVFIDQSFILRAWVLCTGDARGTEDFYEWVVILGSFADSWVVVERLIDHGVYQWGTYLVIFVTRVCFDFLGFDVGFLVSFLQYFFFLLGVGIVGLLNNWCGWSVVSCCQDAGRSAAVHSLRNFWWSSVLQVMSHKNRDPNWMTDSQQKQEEVNLFRLICCSFCLKYWVCFVSCQCMKKPLFVGGPNNCNFRVPGDR